MSRHKEVCHIISWNFMSRHVICHDYRGIPTLGLGSSYYIQLISLVTLIRYKRSESMELAAVT